MFFFAALRAFSIATCVSSALPVPRPIRPFLSPATSATESVYCWGDDTYGQIGNGKFLGVYTSPQLIPKVKLSVVRSGKGGHICGLTDAGQAYCWGNNDSGQVGIGTVGASVGVPTKVDTSHALNKKLIFKDITMGEAHTCGVDQESYVYCWGDNAYGQLGVGTFDNGLYYPVKPVTIVDYDGHEEYLKVKKVSAGANHTCFIDLNNKTWCTGRGQGGQLGLNSRYDQAYPQLINP